MANTNYGTLLQSSDMAETPVFTTIGQARSQGFPAIITEALEMTNHSSGGFKEFIPSGLQAVDEFEAEYNFTPAVLAAFYDDMAARTKRDYKIVNNDDLSDFTFSAYIKSIKIGDADAQNPDVITGKIGFRPTGAIGGMV